MLEVEAWDIQFGECERLRLRREASPKAVLCVRQRQWSISCSKTVGLMVQIRPKSSRSRPVRRMPCVDDTPWRVPENVSQIIPNRADLAPIKRCVTRILGIP